MTITVFNDSNGISHSNSSGILKVELAKVLYSFSVKLKTQENDREYQTEAFKGTFDFCSLSKGIPTIIANVLAEMIKNTSNLPLLCPIKPGHYYGYNSPIFDDKFVPSLMLGKGRAIEYSIILKVRLQKSKAMQFLLRQKVHLKLVPSIWIFKKIKNIV